MKSYALLQLFALTLVCLFSPAGAQKEGKDDSAKNDFVSLDHPLYEIRPRRLGLDKGKGTFYVKLKKSPSARAPGRVSLMFPDGLSSTKCTLDFTSENYETEQKVVVDARPSLGNLSPQISAIKLEACLPDTNITSAEDTKADYMVKPGSSLAIAGTCTSSGDPHIKPFQGAQFTEQTNGAYYLFYSDTVEVQANIIQANGVNGQLAVRFFDTAYVVTTKNNKLEVDLLSNAANADHITVTQPENSATIDLMLGDGTKVHAYCQGANFLGITINPGSSGYTNTKGHCFTSRKADAKVPADKNMFDEKLVIPEAVRVKPDQAGVCQDKAPACPEYVPPPPPPAPVATPEQPKAKVSDPERPKANVTAPVIAPAPIQPTVLPPAPAPRPKIVIPQGCHKVNVATTYNHKKAQAVIASPRPPVTPMPIADARARCSALEDNRLSNVNRTEYTEACAMDLAASGNPAVVEATRVSYEKDCRDTIQNMATSLDPNERKEAKKAVKMMQKVSGCQKDSDCGGAERGKCIIVNNLGTCECGPLYGGKGCKDELSKPQYLKDTSGSMRLVVTLSAVALLTVPLVYMY
ncbi:MAG: hypothetical protein SGCHY_003691 [Lobulomycetales sp.]